MWLQRMLEKFLKLTGEWGTTNIMKKIAALIFSAMVSFSAFASEPILVAEADDETIAWFAYPDTFVDHRDGYSVMVGVVNVENGKAVRSNREFLAITKEDCQTGVGTLIRREFTSEQWRPVAAVNLRSTETTGDKLAQFICMFGLLLEQPDQPANDKRTMM